ncbi:MAG TPA: diguanylate cyclase [Nitrospirota bacterium]|nr:diguanylate cyclase [Nitrospirota bacterium]
MHSPLSHFVTAILDRLVPARFFARLSIANKILFGYMALVLLTAGVVAYVLINLQKINNLNQAIIKVDIVVEEAADNMLDALLAQDTYEKRYLILKSDDVIRLFNKRGQEFNTWLRQLTKTSDSSYAQVNELDAYHTRYTNLFEQEISFIQARNLSAAAMLSNKEMKFLLDRQLDILRTLSLKAKEAQDRKMRLISAIGSDAFQTTTILCLVSVIIGAVASLIVTYHISSSLHKLKIATEHVAEGNFDYDPLIRTSDEVGGLADAFLAMGKRLRKLEEMYLDASPLTRLPGGIAIENVLKKRIESRHAMALCVLDLDNFKAFNDRYGYAHGSEVIKETARIIEAAVKLQGTADDFIGHVGGDDFVVITEPERMRTIAAEIIEKFDKQIPFFYDETDRSRGFILGKTRQGIQMQFPIMSISIAIVTNEKRTLTNPLEASEIAAELKDYAKTIAGSVFVVDKRRGV